jgi:hypothetical protein
VRSIEVIISIFFLSIISGLSAGFFGATHGLSFGCHPFEDFPGFLPLHAADPDRVGFLDFYASFLHRTHVILLNKSNQVFILKFSIL